MIYTHGNHSTLLSMLCVILNILARIFFIQISFWILNTWITLPCFQTRITILTVLYCPIFNLKIMPLLFISSVLLCLFPSAKLFTITCALRNRDCIYNCIKFLCVGNWCMSMKHHIKKKLMHKHIMSHKWMDFLCYQCTHKAEAWYMGTIQFSN